MGGLQGQGGQDAKMKQREGELKEGLLRKKVVASRGSKDA